MILGYQLYLSSVSVDDADGQDAEVSLLEKEVYSKVSKESDVGSNEAVYEELSVVSDEFVDNVQDNDIDVFKYNDDFDQNSSPLFTKDLFELNGLLALDESKSKGLSGIVLNHIIGQRSLSSQKYNLYEKYGTSPPEDVLILLEEERHYNEQILEDSLRNFLSIEEQKTLKSHEADLIRKNREMALGDIARYAETFISGINKEQKQKVKAIISGMARRNLDEFPLGVTFQEGGSSPEVLDLPRDRAIYKDFKLELRSVLDERQKEIFDNVKYF